MAPAPKNIIKRTAAAVFSAAVHTRAALYDNSLLTPVRLDGIKILSVGNLTVGGSGKTPFVMYLAQFLQQQGYPTAVLLRGYKGTMESKGGIVSEGRGPIVDPRQAGDEAYLVASRTQGISVYVGADRVRSAAAARDGGAAVAILDDGFSHRRLHRDLDILLASPEDFAPSADFFPSGRLREPASAVARARLIGGFAAEWQDAAADFTFNYVPVCTVDLNAVYHPLNALPRRVHLLSAIARPERFHRTARDAGFECVGVSTFRDHHRFTASDLGTVFAEAAANAAEAILTTEKDLVRISPRYCSRQIFGLRIETQIQSGWNSLHGALERLFC